MAALRYGVRLELEDGRLCDLQVGDLIGRAPWCALQLADVRISEAHAMVSHRKDGLALLALRGRLSVDGKPRTRVALEVGLRVVLAGTHPLTVRDIALPSDKLVVLRETHGSTPTPLARVVTLYADREPVALFDPDGLAHVLGGSGPPRLRAPDQPDLPLEVGASFTVGPHRFRLVALAQVPVANSTSDRGEFDLPLRVVVRFDSVLVTDGAGKGVALDGSAARVVSELAELRAPVAWTELARLLWKGEPDAATRHRWDQLLVRIRSKLRQAGLRADLVRANRGGLVELVLGPQDKLRVET